MPPWRDRRAKMRLSSPWLIGSLAFNALFAAAWLLRPAAATAQARSRPTEARAAAAGAVAAGSPVRPTGTALVAALGDVDDLPGLVARLRAAGFPPAFVQTVVTAIVDDRFLHRPAAPRPVVEVAAYWRRDFGGQAIEMAVARDRARDQASREAEKRRLLRQLLGSDFHAIEDALDPARRVREFGDLPGERVDRLRQIQDDYAAQVEQTYTPGTSHRREPGGVERAAALREKRRAEIEAVLTPVQLLEYDLRNSSAAQALRHRFESYPLTEAEFRALFPAQQAWDRVSQGNAPEVLRQREEASRQLEAHIRQLLGETRYAEFLQATDPNYQRAREFLTRQGLPLAMADPFLEVQREIRARVDVVRNDRDLTTNQRDAQLAALRMDATRRLTAVLGREGFEAYATRPGGGAWIDSLPATVP